MIRGLKRIGLLASVDGVVVLDDQRCEHALGLIVSQDGGLKAVKSVKGKLHLREGVLD